MAKIGWKKNRDDVARSGTLVSRTVERDDHAFLEYRAQRESSKTMELRLQRMIQIHNSTSSVIPDILYRGSRLSLVLNGHARSVLCGCLDLFRKYCIGFRPHVPSPFSQKKRASSREDETRLKIILQDTGLVMP